MKLFKTTILMVIITLISIALGFVKESVIVCKLGVSWQADSFVFSSMLPGMLFSTLGGVISTTFLPIYTDIRINKSTNEANNFATVFINYIVIICFIMVIMGEIYTGVIVKILAPGFQGKTYILTVQLVRIVLPSLIFLGITYSLIGVLESFKDLVVTSAISIPVHICIIISLIIFYPKLGIKWSMVVVLISSVIQMILVIINCRKWNFKYYMFSSIGRRYIKEAFKMIGPMIFGIMALQLNMMIDRMIASTLEAGSLTSINLASKLNNASYSSIGYIIVLLIFPMLSESICKKDMLKFNKILNNGIILVSILMIPMTIIMCMFSPEIISILFGYGKFTLKDNEYICKIFTSYAIGTCCWGIKDILNRAFYSLKDTMIPMKNSIISVAINIILDLILVKYMGVNGLAMATSIAMIISSLLLIRDINIRTACINVKYILINFSKVCISSFGMYIIIKYIKSFNVIIESKFSKCMYIFLVCLVALFIYIAFLYFLDVYGIKKLISNIKKIFKRGKKYV